MFNESQVTIVGDVFVLFIHHPPFTNAERTLGFYPNEFRDFLCRHNLHLRFNATFRNQKGYYLVNREKKR